VQLARFQVNIGPSQATQLAGAKAGQRQREQQGTVTIDDWPALPPQIQDRDADVWEPLIAVADAVGGVWPERARVAAVALAALSREAEPSLGIKLLTDLRTVFGDFDSLATKSILAALCCLEEAPWGDLRGKPLDERGLARRLSAYGIKSASVRVGDSVLRGYRREDLHDTWSRYLLPSADNSATSATSATHPQNTDQHEVDVTRPLDVNPDEWSFHLDEAS
jgi:Protein of unknown function (DUF3631)